MKLATAYSIPILRRPLSLSLLSAPSTVSNIFSSETAWPIKAKFYLEPPWEGGTKFYIDGPGDMTKMVATPIRGSINNFVNFLYQTSNANDCRNEHQKLLKQYNCY